MAKNYFNLNTEAILFNELEKMPVWWRTMLSDKDLYVNVRKDNRINVYYRGASVLELSASKSGEIKGRIHRKYFDEKADKVYITVKPENIAKQLTK